MATGTVAPRSKYDVEMPDHPAPSLRDLPVAAVLGDAVMASRGGAVVVTAPPGSGKTMLVPAAILDDLPSGGKVVLLQPRRLAARAVAHQIARLRGVPLGGEVGYQVRFDAKVSRDTRLVVETTGIMLRRLLDDAALEGIVAVVLDEFHERTVEMDLVLGLLLRAQETVRPDLRIVVMSATLAAEPVARLLGQTRGRDCPVVSAAGRVYPAEIRYGRRGEQRELVDLAMAAVAEALRATDGHVLVFLPGVGEIVRCEQALSALADREGCELLPLFGDLPPEAQDRVLVDLGRRKIILATNVAETSVTIPGVTAVVDSGLARQMRVAGATGLPRLERIPISKASADQRAGRAGRTAPGICWRLWDEASHHHRPQAETPEILRGDFAGPLLQLLALGERGEFPWLDPPLPEAVGQARTLLARLGALEPVEARPPDRLSPLGREIVRLPAHPRLARLLLAGATHGVLREASIAAAMLSERDPFRVGGHARHGPRDRHNVRTRSDVVDRVVALQAFHEGIRFDDADLELHPGGARSVLRTAEQLYRLVDVPLAPRAADPATALMRALLEAFPDRLARLRPGAADRATMVGGRGVRLDGGSRVRHEPLFLAIDLDDAGGEARVRQASAVDREWLAVEPLATVNLRVGDELLYQPARRQVEARRCTTWIDLVLDETPVQIADMSAAAMLLAREVASELDRVLPSDDSAAGRFLARVRWLAAEAPDLGLPACDDTALAALLPDICHGLRSLDEVQAADWLSRLQTLVGYERLAEIDRLAPAEIELPGGKRHRLTYEPGKPPVLAVRIQELFGVAQTPRVAGGRRPVLLHLLGPNHRPQQVTDDLASFWLNTYPQVKNELRRRYPKHAWPDDPLAARATRNDGKRRTT
ncbi:MAG: ATP-dependent helicase HrpB [Planctomycetia bacterium]|nr:ATP-dependent helicase HrpB [Planctomycetia bacterium]